MMGIRIIPIVMMAVVISITVGGIIGIVVGPVEPVPIKWVIIAPIPSPPIIRIAVIGIAIVGIVGVIVVWIIKIGEGGGFGVDGTLLLDLRALD